ncbi:hypothetical protein HZ994_01545 [Akkermansiaceae bacterium]|nr:hypothetical protein HZ994_01545 [Akkermansiaceae bacterium]
MRNFRILALLALLLPSCAEKAQEQPTAKEEEKPKPRLVGRIASIPAGRKFTLIQAYGKWDIPTGSILTTQGPEGRAANLLATGEKLGQYAAADIQSGILEVGDGVYSTVIPPEPAAVPETDGDPSDSQPPITRDPPDTSPPPAPPHSPGLPQ